MKRILTLGMSVFLIGCAASQARFTPLDKAYPSLPKDAKVEVFEHEPPGRPYIKVARLDVHLEKTHFVGSSLKNALPQLEAQARRAGAEAIIDIKERSSMLAETKIYHVTATGIRYTDQQP